MTQAELIALIRKCWYETTMADAFRKAAHVDMQPMDLERIDKEAERKERYWRNMMSGRIGALDRVR